MPGSTRRARILSGPPFSARLSSTAMGVSRPGNTAPSSADGGSSSDESVSSHGTAAAAGSGTATPAAASTTATTCWQLYRSAHVHRPPRNTFGSPPEKRA